ncbi:MAG: 50S ribosomal protein L4 [Armatimonadota bacterium]|nr:50S ribosomal protein L4 [Armatimonadota bacterium]MDR7534093.1 50S ribosomal protein L4 [Armatimonadota bacterium]MDR7537444.1 50S ribosomal protein L4 [Armatimonadota bacterium]
MVRAVAVDATGARTGEVELPAAIFGLRPYRPVIHQAVVIEHGNARRGTHATKTRGQVRGGGRKPWRQKGTGRARHGSRRSPLWKGGGIVFGPRPRDYRRKLNRRERTLALRAALSAQAQAGRITVLHTPPEAARPRTALAARLLESVGAAGGAVVITGAADGQLARAAANLRGVRVVPARRLLVRALLAPKPIVITQAALAELEEVLAS